MRAFTDIERELGLERFLASPLGTLYYVPFSPGAPRIIVRHFDGELPPAFAATYGDLVRALARFAQDHDDLERVVRVEPPTEVGTDFVARPHHTYYTSIDAYDEWNDPPAAPRQLAEARDAIRSRLSGASDDRSALLATVLARSLLEPNGKTFFDEDERRFVVVDPKLTREDIERWAALATTLRG